MELTQSLFNRLREHCTPELLSYIKNIHIEDASSNEWDVTGLIEANDHLYEILKIIYAFEKLDGSLIYKGKKEIFPIIIRHLNNPDFLGISLFWEHNEINGDIPIFDIGELEIPKIMPKFSAIPFEDGYYYVEERKGNKRIRLTKEKFSSLQEAKDKAFFLNSTAL